MSWQLASFLILGAALTLGFAWYERSRPPARVLALVAALAALAVVGRIAFAPLPNVKPTTDIVLFAGYALGPAPGLAVGAVTALVSNIFFSHGPWTPWQMAGWGGVGLAGGALGWAVRRLGARRATATAGGAEVDKPPRELGRLPLALFCGLAGLGFGLFMDLYLWTLAAEQTLASYLVISARSLPFNLAHAVGNVAFCLLIGPPLVRALRRYRRRFEVSWPAPAVARSAAALLVVASAAVAALAAATPEAQAASATGRAASWLVGAQNTDGGFGGGAGQSSSHLYTGWAGLGLAATGRNPRDVTERGNSIIDFTKDNARSLDDTGDLQRTILLARAAKVSARDFAGRNLHARLLSRRSSNGSFHNGVSHTNFGVLAMRAAGESAGSSRVRRSAQWIADQQHEDGGFSLCSSCPSDPDITGGALQALAAAGYGGGSTADRAVAFLADAQAPGGGFGQSKGSSPNAQSTSLAVMGLVAVGRGSGPTVSSALSYLRSLQASAGSVRYSRGSRTTPVWVTGQALLALQREALPLGPVALRPRSRPEPQDDAESTPPSTEKDPSAAAERGSPRREGDKTGDRPRRASETAPPPPPALGPAAPSSGGTSPALGDSAVAAADALGPSPSLSPRSPGARAGSSSAGSGTPGPDAVPIGGASALKPLDALERPERGDEGDGPGLALTLIGALVAGLMATIALSARGRRLWAVMRGKQG